MNIEELLKIAIDKLKEGLIDNPVLISKIVLADRLGVGKEYLLINNRKMVDSTIEKEYLEDIEKISKGYPVQYVTNKKEFMNLEFFVDKNVLVPRQDTEGLVEEVIKYITSFKKTVKALELCVGSGAICVSVAKNTENVSFIASDISKKALDVAKKNARLNNCLEQIEFVYSDMFENISNDKRFDVIISNPPYIETKNLESLDKNVKYEPRLALDGGKDGFKFYDIIAKNADEYLTYDGAIFLEIGYNQKESVSKLFLENGFLNIKCIKDLGQNDRVLIIKMK